MKDYNKYGTPREKKSRIRMLCLTLCMTVLMLTGVGCIPFAKTETVTALQNDLTDAVNELSTLNDAYAAALLEIALLKTAQEEVKKELEALETEHENTKGDLAVLENKNQEAEQEIDALKETNATSKQELELLKAAYQLAQQEIASLKEALGATQEEMDDLRLEYAAAQLKIESLKAKIEALENQLAPPDSTEKIKIYIDQGHNPTSYHNAGAFGNGLYEQDLTFEIGILLAALLEADGRFEVCLSRPTANTVLGTDGNSSLDARVQGAIDFGADYFISLHINSYESSSANGIEIYVAKQESEAYAFGNSMLKGLIDSTGLKDRGMKINSEFRVLKNATMPAALLEMGFISNAEDAALLSGHPELFAKGIYNGILDYFQLKTNSDSIN